MAGTTAYSLGVDACRRGWRRSDNPYDTKKLSERQQRLEWIQGYADQARREAEEALAAAH